MLQPKFISGKMDVFKFIILSVACLSGFMVTSYQGIAEQRGWKIGTWFDLNQMSWIAVLGFICQWGSVVISFFVNPWWSAILVLIVGFVGNIILTSILKAFTQIIAIPLVIASFFLVSVYAFSPSSPMQSSSQTSTINKNIDHFITSIEYANEANRVSNEFDSSGKASGEKLNEIVEFRKKALEEAGLVDTEQLNNQVASFGSQYKNSFIQGLQLFIEGHTENNSDKFFEGQKLLFNWEIWFRDNYNRIVQKYEEL